MTKVRAMLADAGLPRQYWAEAAVTASLLRNLSPAAGISTTPYEAFHGTRPDVSMLRAYGCLAYAHVPAQLRTKLDARATKGVLVGYNFRGRLYRIAINARILEIRDVVCAESKVGWAEVGNCQRGDTNLHCVTPICHA